MKESLIRFSRNSEDLISYKYNRENGAYEFSREKYAKLVEYRESLKREIRELENSKLERGEGV
jgi:hypothetical protein